MCLIKPWYINDVPYNFYNETIPRIKLINPIQFYNDLVYRNKIVTTIITPETSGMVSSILIDYKYLVNISTSVYNKLIAMPEVLNNIESVVITYLQQLDGLGNLIEYFYNQGKKLNIITPLQPVFMLNLYNQVLYQYYNNNEPMFTINWVSTVDTNTLLTLDNFITSNTVSLNNFINNPLYTIGGYNMPFTFYNGNGLLKMYFELVDTIYFTYVLHVYKFSLKTYEPIVHTIYITHNEIDVDVEDIISQYPFLNESNVNNTNDTFAVFYSSLTGVEQYNQNVTVVLNSQSLNNFTLEYPPWTEPQFIEKYRNTYDEFTCVTYQTSDNSNLVLK